MIIGYARVCEEDQHIDLQIHALKDMKSRITLTAL